MHRRTGVVLAILLWGSTVGVAVGDDLPPASAETETAADDILALVNAVLEHHFRPPTKQEMVLEAVRSLAKATPAEVPDEADLAREISMAADDAALREIVRSACRRLREANASAPSDLYVAIAGEGVFEAAPFGGSVATAKDQDVNEQFAANRYVGIGIALKMEESEPRRPAIAAIVPGGPCAAAGIPEGARFLEIDEWSTEGQSLEEVVDRIRGPEGTDVTLVMQFPDEDEPRRVILKRGVVPMKSVSVTEPNGERRAVVSVRIARLSSSVPHELRDLASRIGTPREIRIDLSGVDQGTVHNAILIADEILDSGTIGFVVERGSRRRIEAQPGALFENIPITVIVGRNTSGPAEWLAQSLIENGRATAAGEPSAGAAVGMSVHPLPGGRMVVQIPTQRLLSPSEKPLLASLERRSLRPMGSSGADQEFPGRILPPAPSKVDLQEFLRRRQDSTPDLLEQFLKPFTQPARAASPEPAQP